MAKIRLDQLLVKRDLYSSRSRAQAAIMAGLVLVSGARIDKAGTLVPDDCDVEIKGALHPYVSRGGLKLKKALEEFGVNPKGAVAVDVGASTGGFTHCLLEHGAAKVYAVDVGYGQLDWKLRQDSRVIVMERTNVRSVTPAMFPDPPVLAVVDVAFISLQKVFPPLLSVLDAAFEIICLVKPQFEAGRDLVGKKGVVRDPAVHRDVLMAVIGSLQNLGPGLLGLTYSPLRGPEGNIEYLAHFSSTAAEVSAADLAKDVVDKAHQDLD